MPADSTIHEKPSQVELFSPRHLADCCEGRKPGLKKESLRKPWFSLGAFIPLYAMVYLPFEPHKKKTTSHFAFLLGETTGIFMNDGQPHNPHLLLIWLLFLLHTVAKD